MHAHPEWIRRGHDKGRKETHQKSAVRTQVQRWGWKHALKYSLFERCVASRVNGFYWLGAEGVTGERLEAEPPSSRAEGLLFLHGLESNPGSSLQTEEEAGLP